jgi:threonine/homoserine/homoserine lactone efflux protein
MVLQVFIIGTVVSFIGSIPPGTLNILVLQMGLEKKVRQALLFALAVAIVEYPYAWIAVAFEHWITSSAAVAENFQLLGAVVMTTLGVFSLWSARKPTTLSVRFQESGFARGMILSLLNPQAIPYWIGVTAYLKMQGWIDLSTGWRMHSYILGTSVGAMLLLSLLALLANRMSYVMQHNRYVKLIPGSVLLSLGLFAFGKYFFAGA